MKQQMVYIVGLFFVFSFAYGSHGKVLLKENIYDEYPIDTVQGFHMELPLPEVSSTLRESLFFCNIYVDVVYCGRYPLFTFLIKIIKSS